MLGIAGTIPIEDLPLLTGGVTMENGNIRIDGRSIPVDRGTAALIGAAVKTAEVLGTALPRGIIVGDIGRGAGSRTLYKYLVDTFAESGFHTCTFHYLQPIVHWHNRLQKVIHDMEQRPVLIADAGFMYVAKMGGHAAMYDLFTPDIGELSFLADETAPHPFYTRGFILHDENRVPDLIARAYEHNNAARYLLVKGKRDCIAGREGILGEVDSPVEEAMEAIGGTGDILTGILSALIYSGMDIEEAAIVAMRTNRIAGSCARPTPATQIIDIIRHIPKALENTLSLQ
ncbi:MAG: sugar kinase [delta proteobacterium MLS_D]|jgi:ADP-dependent NAD(P)H-hydrate dehydratase / NAD(P)H-hydrate epimerase|nr:MAG: sugar kinase [delta proteobacterium MLS_D]